MLSIIVSLLMLYSFELLLTSKFLKIPNYGSITHKDETSLKKRIKRANELGIFFDKRTKQEVIKEHTPYGYEITPNYHPYMLARDKINNNGLVGIDDSIFPLGGISNKVRVGRNETGKWMVYEADNYGFNNPLNAFKRNVDIFLVGDSYTEGESVANDKNIASILRDAGYDVYNCGMAGNGFLIEYATLVEYAKKIKPKNVFWIYSANDFADFGNELNSDLLIKYLSDKNFSQGLTSKQAVIDSLLKKYMDMRYIDYLKQKKMSEWSFISTLKLIEVRKLSFRAKQKLYNHFRDYYSRNGDDVISEKHNSKIMEAALSKKLRKLFINSKGITNQWGGKLFFVYLPSGNTYLVGREDPYKDYLKLLMKELDIDFIDLTNDFVNHEDPLSLFPLRMFEAHYNYNGYKLVADRLMNHLAEK